MNKRRNIVGINGSASRNSSNLTILESVAALGKPDFDLNIIDDLADFPIFRTELTDEHIPGKILAFRNQIKEADGIIICTPEYVFSIPGRLKNIIEWCVSTTVFSGKPTGIITASAMGEKGHEELQLIMKTLMAKFTSETTLLIQGVKGKVNRNGDIVDENTKEKVKEFVKSFIELKDK